MVRAAAQSGQALVGSLPIGERWGEDDLEIAPPEREVDKDYEAPTAVQQCKPR